MTDMIADGEYAGSLELIGYTGMVHQEFGALVAGAFPVKPPTEWFSKPEFQRLMPLSIDKDGRVSGHIAAWHQSHIGMAGSIKPPKSRSRYAFFQTGQLETAEGDLIDVGQITLSGGHAPLNATVADAVAHYDNTQSAVMDVAAYEDRHGIVVAGALRPNVTDEQLREIRASAVSGDWRPINGHLELVAVCAVNVPGFPIPRARVASGTPVALVAAGIEPLLEMSITQAEQPESERSGMSPDIDAALAALHQRTMRLEAMVAGAAIASRSALDEAIIAAAAPVDDARESLRARVHSNVTASAADPVAELRKRVHKAD